MHDDLGCDRARWFDVKPVKTSAYKRIGFVMVLKIVLMDPMSMLRDVHLLLQGRVRQPCLQAQLLNSQLGCRVLIISFSVIMTQRVGQGHIAVTNLFNAVMDLMNMAVQTVSQVLIFS
jgi:hypothetical protein